MRVIFNVLDVSELVDDGFGPLGENLGEAQQTAHKESKGQKHCFFIL